MPRRNHKHKPIKHTPFNLGGASAMTTCQNKKAFASQFEAERSIIRSKQYDPDIEQTVYYCPNCQRYHLTSKKS